MLLEIVNVYLNLSFLCYRSDFLLTYVGLLCFFQYFNNLFAKVTYMLAFFY